MKRTDGKGDISEAALQRAKARLAKERAGSESPTNTISPVAITAATTKSELKDTTKEVTDATPPLPNDKDRPTKKKSDLSMSTRGPSLAVFAKTRGSSSSKTLSSSHPAYGSQGGVTPNGSIAEHGSLAALSSIRSSVSSTGGLSRANSSLTNERAKEDLESPSLHKAKTTLGRLERRNMNPAIAKIASQDVFNIDDVAPDIALRQRQLAKKRMLEKELSRERWRQSLGPSDGDGSSKDHSER